MYICHKKKDYKKLFIRMSRESERKMFVTITTTETGQRCHLHFVFLTLKPNAHIRGNLFLLSDV